MILEMLKLTVTVTSSMKQHFIQQVFVQRAEDILYFQNYGLAVDDDNKPSPENMQSADAIP